MEQIEYSRTVVPSTMRSPYWKYFGFPSDNGNNILTRQKIVCTLCNTAIAYNKNTSNLRTHLMAKHTEVFQKILTLNRMEEPDDSSDVWRNAMKKKRCGKSANSSIKTEQISPSNIVEHEHQNTGAGDVVYKERLAGLEENSVSSPSNPSLTYLSAIKPLVTPVDIIMAYTGEKPQQSLENMLADMIQTDLLSMDTIKGQGFRMYSQQVSGLPLDDPTLQNVTDILRQRIADIRQLIDNHVHQLSQLSPYSLSMECYSNSDDITIFNIYFNFFNASQSQLNSILYKTVIVENHLNIFELLINVNLKNCIVILVNDLQNVENFILEFAKMCEMDLIECLASTLTRCFQRIFELDFVIRNFKDLCDSAKQNKLYVARSSRCSWFKFKHLEDIYNSRSDENLVNNLEMKLIYDYIKPLKTALDIISDEQLPLCSLSRPLIIKLFEQHFDNQKDNQYLAQIYSILEEELKRCINGSFLSEATYFDSRFRQDFSLPDLPFDFYNFRAKVMQRFKHQLNIQYDANPSSTLEEEHADTLSTNARKSNLKSFFNRTSDSQLTFNSPGKTNIDIEFELYNSEAAIDLDQNPVLWWREHAQNFQELQKIVLYYLTTPCCCVHRLYSLDIEEQCLKLNRRKQLSQFCEIEGNLWYLYYNYYMLSNK